VVKLSDDAGLWDYLVEPLEVNHLTLLDVLGAYILVLINLHESVDLPTNVRCIIKLSRKFDHVQDVNKVVLISVIE
jgi:hypothetical protein